MACNRSFSVLDSFCLYFLSFDADKERFQDFWGKKYYYVSNKTHALLYTRDIPDFRQKHLFWLVLSFQFAEHMLLAYLKTL